MLIVIPGEPVGKGRPKFSTRGGYTRAYTPKKTAAYEDQVLTAYMIQCKGESYEKGVYLKANIRAYFQIPKSASKENKEKMRRGKLRPAKKPDIDNIMKICCDALNGSAFYDDCWITSGSITKRYSDDPRVEIEIVEDEE